MKEILMKPFGCRIVIGEEIYPELAKLEKGYSSIFIIADEAVAELYGEQVIAHLQASAGGRVDLLTFPSGESAKSIARASALWEALIAAGADRSSLIVSLGGGVASDLSGFVASTYMRGVDLIHLPTTLLAMVDASIGGKTGINLTQGKNLVGTIYHPKLILMELNTLRSLPERELRSGYAEVIKSALIGDPHLHASLLKGDGALEDIVYRTALIKAGVVDRDEKERGERAHLNYGHTFCHAIETATCYSEYLHGEAVSIGMSAASYVAKHLGFVDDSFIREQDGLLRKYGLPIELPPIDNATLIFLMKRDKKSRAGKIHLIVPKKVGTVVLVADVAEELIFEAMEEKRRRDSLGRD